MCRQEASQPMRPTRPSRSREISKKQIHDPFCGVVPKSQRRLNPRRLQLLRPLLRLQILRARLRQLRRLLLQLLRHLQRPRLLPLRPFLRLQPNLLRPLMRMQIGRYCDAASRDHRRKKRPLLLRQTARRLRHLPRRLPSQRKARRAVFSLYLQFPMQGAPSHIPMPIP